MVPKISRVSCLFVLLTFVCIGGSGCGRPIGQRGPAAPRNVIVLIGDGMGFEHLKAAGLYANGREGSLFLQTLPYRAEVQTISVPSANAKPGQPHVTDSAAAATALATGHKVYNGVISVALPGDGQPYQTALESFAVQGKKTGLVSTAYITDATPAGFGAHSAGRGNSEEIGRCYLEKTRPDVILGGGESSKKSVLTSAAIQEAGYELVTDREGLASLQLTSSSRVFGLFGKSNIPFEADKIAAATQPAKADLLRMPGLPEMTATALKIVSTERKGFFLMVEGGLIDKAAHKNDLARSVPETVEFDKAVKVAMDWARKRKDTLVIVTADHETGGLKVVQGRGKGQLPEVIWSSSGHTSANVPLYAWGAGARKVRGALDNTDVCRLMMGTFKGSTARLAASPASQPATQPQPAAAAAAD